MKKLMELKENKIFKIVYGVLKALFIVALIAFIFVVCLQRFSGNRLSFFNYRMFTVISGSMKPKYDIGDVLIAKEVEASKIKVGDTISYLGQRGEFMGKVITHEVIGIDKDDKGKYVFRTKGLANVIEDPIVFEEQLYGVVVYKSIILSFVYGIVGTGPGMYLFVIIPLFIIIGTEIITTMLERENKKRGLSTK